MKCHKCGKPVFFAERKTSLGYEWHPECLRCEECGKRLNPGQHAEHKGVPYCHIPCYSVLFGPTLFGHGSQVEAHTSFGKAGNRQGTPVPRTHLEAKLRIYNNYFEGKSGIIQSRERNGRLILEGPLRIFWGVNNVIHLKEEHDDRMPVRRRNSYCHTPPHKPENNNNGKAPSPEHHKNGQTPLPEDNKNGKPLSPEEKSALVEKDPNLLNSLLSLPMVPLSDLDLDLDVSRATEIDFTVSPTHYKTLPAGGLNLRDNEHTLSNREDTLEGKEHTLEGKENTSEGKEQTLAGNGHMFLNREDTLEGNEVTLESNEHILEGNGHALANREHTLEGNEHERKEHNLEGNGHTFVNREDTLANEVTLEGNGHTLVDREDTLAFNEVIFSSNEGTLASNEPNLERKERRHSLAGRKHSLEGKELAGNDGGESRGSVVQLRRRPRVSQKSKLKRRCSINGHFYNRETSVFTPAFASITSVWVTSLVTAPEVINMLLDKFKVVNNPEDFALYVVKDTGERRCMQEGEYPLLARVMLGPSEDVAKVFIMNKYLAREITAEVAQYIKFSDTELKMFLHKFNEEEKKEAQRITRKYQEKKARIQARMDELRDVQQTGL